MNQTDDHLLKKREYRLALQHLPALFPSRIVYHSMTVLHIRREIDETYISGIFPSPLPCLEGVLLLRLTQVAMIK